jgi:multiple sugar transport system permease protein
MTAPRPRPPAAPRTWAFRLGRLFGTSGTYVLLAAMTLVTVAPFVWMIGTALKTQQEIFVYPPTLWPAEPQWGNFAAVLDRVPFLRFYWNSVVVTVVITVTQVVTSALAGYAFARIEFPLKNAVFVLFLATLIIPNQVTMLPLFLLVSRLGWIDTYQALTVPFLANAFAVFFLRQFFLTVPRELEEAATIDGAGRMRVLFTIVLPLARPALATIALFIFLGEWDNYLWPLIVTNSQEMRTLPIGLRFFVEESGSQLHLMMAGAVMAVAPILLLFFMAQKQFIEGIAMTGSKG